MSRTFFELVKSRSLSGTVAVAVVALLPSNAMAVGSGNTVLPVNHTHQDKPVNSPKDPIPGLNEHDAPSFGDDLNHGDIHGYTTSTHTHQDGGSESSAAPLFIADHSDVVPGIGDDGFSFGDILSINFEWHTVQESIFQMPDFKASLMTDALPEAFISPIDLEPIAAGVLSTPDDFNIDVRDIANPGSDISVPGVVPAPGVLPLLIAGALAGRRRRRR